MNLRASIQYTTIFLMWSLQANHDLVDIQKINPSIRLDIRYATTNNFTQRKVYSHAKCYVRAHVAKKLDAVQKELESMDLGLVVFDGYRPLDVQKLFWQLVPDPRYVAPPTEGSHHNYGCAVDCSLVKKDGTPLPMGTDFDDFTEKAHRNFTDLGADVIKNRKLLEEIMVKHGFLPMPYEWWHFDDADWKKYKILNVSFAELEESN